MQNAPPRERPDSIATRTVSTLGTRPAVDATTNQTGLRAVLREEHNILCQSIAAIRTEHGDVTISRVVESERGVEQRGTVSTDRGDGEVANVQPVE